MFRFEPKLSTAVDEKVAGPGAPPAAVEGPLSVEMLERMHRYWMASNYMTVGQIYLRENPLLREPLKPEQIKPRLLGHWGTSAGQNFIYVHLNRLIKERDADVIFISGPGHGGPSLNAHSWLEGTYTAVHPEVTQDAAGMRQLFRSFSTPGGIPSHAGPHVPNSMHEGGELGYSLLHAFGAAFDNPELIVACVVGDGEAETAALEGSWKSNVFLNPARDGAVLPILHLNGYKISGPTVMARASDEELASYFRGHGYEPLFVEGDDPPTVHQLFAATLDRCYDTIRAIQNRARTEGRKDRPCWPVIVLRTPKGWTGPKEVDGIPIEGTFRAHQVPLATVEDNLEHLHLLEAWMRSYRPEQQFDDEGRLVPELAALAPEGERRMGGSPHVNGGRLLIPLDLPDYTDYALEVPGPGQVVAEAPRKLGEFLRDILKINPRNFRLFAPDEMNSNRLNAVYEVTDRCMMAPTVSIDESVSPDGRAIEVLSENCCEGWLEGYLLTGRHGFWSSYEAFAQIVDSMVTQHAKWVKQAREQPWRRPIASLNILLTSHVWRQDHNGYSHQAPGFVDNVLAKKNDLWRIYYPPDTNSLLATADHCLRIRNTINVITCGKQPQIQWLTMDEAMEHCSRGASRWAFASSDEGGHPDVILAAAGDVPTIEVCAAAWLLRRAIPDLRVRVVNVVDLAILMTPDLHPHGMDGIAFESLFTNDAPVVFAFHGYPWAIHSVIHGRPNEGRFHVRGYQEDGSTTTPFDMLVVNRMSRFHLAIDAIKYTSRFRAVASDLIDAFERKIYDHQVYVRSHMVDMPEIADWHWTSDFRDPEGPPPLAKGQPRAALFTDQ